MPDCTYCDTPALINTAPPLCDRHLDFVIVCEYMASKNIPLNARNISKRIKKCLELGGTLSITPEQVPGLIEDIGGRVPEYEVYNQ